MTIRDNIEAWLDYYEIEGIRFDEETVLPDRSFVFDTRGELLKYCASRVGQFSASTRVLGHGPAARMAFRERLRPSLHVIVYEISTFSPSALDYCFLGLDFDKASPQAGLGSLVIHGVEVTENAITGNTTDQDMIALRLKRRGIPPIGQNI